MYNIDEVGKRIRNERIEKDESGIERVKFSLDVLAEKINVTRQTIAKWESGKSSPTVEDLLQLCNVFGCDYGYLIGDYECRTRKATDIRDETGLSELAIDNLLVCAGAPDEGKIDELLTECPHDNLRAYEIGRFAKIRFIELLLENSDELERLAVAAYDYRRQMQLYERSPLHDIKGIRHDQFAGVAKEEAKEALSALLEKIKWDTFSEEFTGK